ncbi:MAG: hypothetical protein V1911_02840 [Candidatus Micrarchaeota archaeon]
MVLIFTIDAVIASIILMTAAAFILQFQSSAVSPLVFEETAEYKQAFDYSEEVMLALAERDENSIKHHELDLTRLQELAGLKNPYSYCIKLRAENKTLYTSCKNSDALLMVKRFAVCGNGQCALEVLKL